MDKKEYECVVEIKCRANAYNKRDAEERVKEALEPFDIQLRDWDVVLDALKIKLLQES